MNIKISEKFTLKTLAVFAVFFFMVFFCHISDSYAGIKIIRVGVTPSQSLSEKQEDGHFSGYGIDYLRELQKYNPSWKYEFVEGTQEQLLGLLRKQKIDLLFASKPGSFMGNSHNRTNSQGNFSWSNQPVGQINNLLYSRKDNRHLLFNDYERLVKSRIGFLKGSISIKLFEEYMRQYYSPQYNIASQSANNRHIRFYPNEKALMRALERGEIDAMGTTQLAGRHNLQAIAHYGSTPLYLAARNGSGLMSGIDRSLTLVKANNYRFETDLYEKYYREKTITSPLLNKQELDFVKQHDEISVGFLPDRFPVSSYDRETGKLAGINEDIIKIIFENVGLKLKMIPLEQGEKPVDAIKKGKCDLVAGVVYENFTDNSDVLLSIPFLTSDLVMVSKAGYAFQPENPQKMVINKSFQFLQTYIAKEYPNMTISLTNSLEQSMEAVLGGEADILMQNGYVLNYLIQNPRYDSLHIIPTSFTTEHSAIVGSKSHIDPLLISVINKSIASVSQKQINTIVNSHTIAQPYTLTMSDAFYKYRVPFLLFGLLVLICLGSAAAFVVMRQRNYRILDEKNKQLADAVLQAERASQAKGQFLANVSHEIRTPLNAIVGIATIAEKYHSSQEKMQEYMKKITLSSRILLNLINDILDMAAIESKKLRISNNVFNFKDLIVSIGTLYYGECQNKGITFDLGMKNVSEETLIGDSLRLNQILLNLLSNAVKFTPSDGKIKLKIEDIRKENETVFLRFTVSDTGEGMTEELKSRLFKPFEQENAETVRQHGGSGLGLSITKNLVNMMHGSISVESKKGEGSTFTVDLPFGMTEEVQEHNSQKFRTIRALIVDDDPEAREYSSIVLSRLEIRHDMAESGEEAIKMLKAW